MSATHNHRLCGGEVRPRARVSFHADLAAAVDGALQASSAVLFTATGGDYANRVFAVVDANGNGAYQAGTDYVFEFVSPAEPLHGSAIFI